MKITLPINEGLEINVEAHRDTLIPEGKKVIEIDNHDCPQEIVDCFGERKIELMIIEELTKQPRRASEHTTSVPRGL